MPIYEYEHIKEPCLRGKRFDVKHSIHEKPLKKCPHCGKNVVRLVSLCGISAPKTNSELRDLGFSKLVRRDDGVYENVTLRRGESKIVERGKPETLPDIKRIISD